MAESPAAAPRRRAVHPLVRPRRSFAFRLAAAFAGVGIAAAALTAILVNLQFERRFTGYLEEQRHVRQADLTSALAESYRRMGGWDPGDLDRLAPLALMDGGTLRLVDGSGRTVWEASPSDMALSHMHREMMGGGPLGPEQLLSIEADGEPVGTAIARLPEPGVLPADAAFRSSVNRALVLGGIVAALAALGLGAVLARRATAPARELTEAARAFTAGDRDRRVDVGSDDEMGEMARSFNLMADRIDEEDRLRRSFAADVAHELRTPLAILRSQIEAIQDGVVEPTSLAMASLHEEALRLGRLVADLETLASAEAAGFALERRRVDLAPLLADTAHDFAGPFESAGVSLETRLRPVEVHADATRIRQVATNLLSNALKFTPSGGSVVLELDGDDAGVWIRVRDTGPGIPPDELPRVFERFFRGRSGRARGSGIGLTVARELVLAHGGEIAAECPSEGGTVFTVRLPDASPTSLGSFTAPSQPTATVGG